MISPKALIISYTHDINLASHVHHNQQYSSSKQVHHVKHACSYSYACTYLSYTHDIDLASHIHHNQQYIHQVNKSITLSMYVHIHMHVLTFTCLTMSKHFYIICMFRFMFLLWVPISLTGKVSDVCIRDLGFNHHLYQKLIGVLV